MTFPEMVTAVNELIDDSYSNSQYKEWFQMCQDNELLDYLYLPTEVVLTRVGDSFVLPENLKSVIKIQEEVSLGDYEIFAGKVIVSSSVSLSSITLRYDRYPEDIQNATDFEPDIPRRYHRLYVLYAGMMAQINDEETERYAQIKDAFVRAKAFLQGDMHKAKQVEVKRRGWTVIR